MLVYLKFAWRNEDNNIPCYVWDYWFLGKLMGCVGGQMKRLVIRLVLSINHLSGEISSTLYQCAFYICSDNKTVWIIT